MPKTFHTTGICNPSIHYMVDPSEKLKAIKNMIEKGLYFTINRPRQYGKTTTLYLLEQNLYPAHVLISISFEGLGIEAFENPKSFVKSFLNQVTNSLQYHNEQDLLDTIRKCSEPTSMEDLSELITTINRESVKKIILFIDEVDKASSREVFLSFLGLLRSKYLQRSVGKDTTFHSIILASVYDIKNLKLKYKKEEDQNYNSPWNIAADFDIDLSFQPKEIGTMLANYSSEVQGNSGLDNESIQTLSELIYTYTSGYPYLVSKICKIIDERLDRDWSQNGVKKAIHIITEEKNTLFDDLIKNLENNPELYSLVFQILIEGAFIQFNIYNPVIEHASILGIVTKKNTQTKVANTIFEMIVYNYMISKKEMKQDISSYSTSTKQKTTKKIG